MNTAPATPPNPSSAFMPLLGTGFALIAMLGVALTAGGAAMMAMM